MLPGQGVLSGDLNATLTIDPPCVKWLALTQRRPQGICLGRTQEQWRSITREELGLSAGGGVIGTGHQTLLWHPGILAKYLVMDALAGAHNLAMANVVVDQHAEGFGDFEIPYQRADGSLAARRIELCRPRPRKDVPMGRHEAFTPPRPPELGNEVLPSVAEGVKRIFESVYAHRNAANAAMQMANALAELMQPWVRPMVDVTSTDLLNTSLGKAMMSEMANDPWRCAKSYNKAVNAMPEVGIAPLLIRDDYVELPLWRIREDGRRMHAYDGDVQGSGRQSISLMPRALMMTAIARLGLCDLFIHGSGGANYDRAMELWIRNWLGVEVGSVAMATADVRLPLLEGEGHGAVDLNTARSNARRAWHDPLAQERNAYPSAEKRRALAVIDQSARNSTLRRNAFMNMHSDLAKQRGERQLLMESTQRQLDEAIRHTADLIVALRRDWAFSLYPHEMIDELAKQARAAAACG